MSRWHVVDSRGRYLVCVKRAALSIVYEIEWALRASDARTWTKRRAEAYAEIVAGTIREASLSIEETRRRIAARTEPCSDACPGWEVFETNTKRGLEVERCDECFAHLPADQRVMDDDVEQLPEAIAALGRAKELHHG